MSDTLDSIEPNIANYYSIGSRLNSMPFNTSMPLLYINKEAFVKAGLDPNKPPTNLDEIMAAAKKLTVSDRAGRSSAARPCGSTAPATQTPRSAPPGSS